MSFRPARGLKRMADDIRGLHEHHSFADAT
jgi:hypothetical protein